MRSSSDDRRKFSGNLLKDSDSLEAAGVNPGSIVLLYSKRDIVNTSQSAEGDPQKNKEKIIASIKELLKRKALHVIGESTDLVVN